MTVTYTAEVANSSFGCFLKLLTRWTGSIYKLMWKEFLVFFVSYYVLNFIYRFALNPDQKTIFEKVVRYCDAYNNLIPVAFVLGFYVSVIVTRWWDQFLLIPWPDRMAMFVSAHVHGNDDRGRLMRRTIMRYLCLSFVITMSSISPNVKKRFLTFQHMTDAGHMNPNEQKIMESINTPFNKYFVPLAWAASLVTRARKENRIRDDFGVKTLIDEINNFRGMLGGLFNYDWISIPLVYTQVVTLAVYTFFLSCLMGRQMLEKGANFDDMYVPVFTFLQFFFYMGWLKVAESLCNPFGGDDNDFEINTIIDRNLKVSYLVVDEMHQEHPELIKDQYWDETDFDPLYTAATLPLKDEEPYLGSAMKITVSPKQSEFIPLSSIAEFEELNLDHEAATEPVTIAAGDPANNTAPLKGFFDRVIKRSNSKMSRKSLSRMGESRRSMRSDNSSSSAGQQSPVSKDRMCMFEMSELDRESHPRQSTHFLGDVDESTSNIATVIDKARRQNANKIDERYPYNQHHGDETGKYPIRSVSDYNDKCLAESPGCDEGTPLIKPPPIQEIQEETIADTADAVRDLKLHQEKNKGVDLARAISIAGTNVEKDLKLASPSADASRVRTNSENVRPSIV